jgi:hypothetical protein
MQIQLHYNLLQKRKHAPWLATNRGRQFDAGNV